MGFGKNNFNKPENGDHLENISRLIGHTCHCGLCMGSRFYIKKMRMILKNLTFRTRTKNNGLEINEKIYFNQITINDFIQLLVYTRGSNFYNYFHGTSHK